MQCEATLSAFTRTSASHAAQRCRLCRGDDRSPFQKLRLSVVDLKSHTMYKHIPEDKEVL